MTFTNTVTNNGTGTDSFTGELLAEARRSGAKLVLAGDDRQLASIERGGLFAELIGGQNLRARVETDHHGDGVFPFEFLKRS